MAHIDLRIHRAQNLAALRRLTIICHTVVAITAITAASICGPSTMAGLVVVSGIAYLVTRTLTHIEER